MADQIPPGPSTSGRVAGVIAVIALVLGGYYAVIARPAPPSGSDPATAPAETAAAPDAVKSEAGKESADTGEAAKQPEAADSSKSAGSEAANAAPAGESSAPAAGGTEAADTKSADGKSAAEAGDEGQRAAAGSDSAAPADAPASKKSTDVASAPEAGADAGAAGVAAPSFDVVRVEPTGETVVAGLAEPKATVEVLDGSAPIAKGEANDRGEWAIVVEKPLAPGTHDLSIRTTSPDKKIEALSEQRVAIEVPQPGKGDALVVLNAPDAPSRVLQLPEEPKAAPGAGDQLASAETAAKSAEPAADKAAGEASASAPAADEAASKPEGSGTEPAAAGGEPDANAAAAGGAEANSTTAGAADAAGVDAASGDAKSGDAKSTAATEANSSSAPAAAANGNAPATGDAVAAGTEPAASQETAKAGQAAPEDAANSAAAASQDGAISDAASAPDATKPEPAGSQEAAKAAPAAPEPAAPAEPVVEPKVTVDAVEFENGTIYIAGSAATGGTVRIYVDGVAVGDAQTADGGRWLLETKHDIKPGQHTVRADQVDKGTGNVIVRAEVPFEQTVDVAVLAPVTAAGGTSEGASAAGALPPMQNVIIRRGDNLWTISRRLYGKGIRFSTIYEANTDQIRNPHWIYPGQIFVLPAGDARWTN